MELDFFGISEEVVVLGHPLVALGLVLVLVVFAHILVLIHWFK